MSDEAAFREYLAAVEADLRGGRATEHTYRPHLKKLLEALAPGVEAINEPKHEACGAPDYVIVQPSGHGYRTIGYAETKNIGEPLDAVEKGEQMGRYLRALDSLILTDYLEFRWYVNGERRAVQRLATVQSGRLTFDKASIDATAELLRVFLGHRPAPISQPRDLAERMARLAHMIRDLTIASFASGKPSEALSGLHDAFKEVLLPELSVPDFADMFAQTLAYGLFAARCNHTGPDPFRRQDAAAEIPKTNPFLRRLFGTITGPDLNDEPFIGFVDDLTQLLAETDMAAVLKDFGKRTRQEDPMVHFFETFLVAYDPRVRELRGVYYTPQPVVSYIVRSVDAILRRDFGCAAGLADTSTTTYEYTDDHGQQRTATAPRVLILDPACGTGTFPYTVIDHIRQGFQRAGNAGMWSGYVREHILPRIFGFELLMPPYAMAHLKLGMQLAALDLPEAQRKDWAYDFASNERLGVYLTNTLEEAEKRSERLKLGGYISDEANAAASVKQDYPVMVVLGNPPYSGHSANKGKWISALLRGTDLLSGQTTDSYFMVDGSPLGERNPKWLNDDYVKFIRFAQWRIERTGHGVLAFITNHGYLDNPTFRGMRQSLMRTFDEIYVLDLHGNSKKKERNPDGGPDENVFDIQQGVAIGLFIKRRAPSTEVGQTFLSASGSAGNSQVGQTFLSASVPEAGKNARSATVHHAHLWGDREHKYAWLAEHAVTDPIWTTLAPQSPFHYFVPQDTDLWREYNQGWRLTAVIPVNNVGIVTARDALTIHWRPDEIWETVEAFSRMPSEEAREYYTLGPDARDWQVALAQKDIKSSGPSKSNIVPLLYRPFDLRYTYYTGISRGFHCMPRPEVMRLMLAGRNVGIIATRQTRDKWDVFASRNIMGHKSVAAYDINTLFPLYLYPDPHKPALMETEAPSIAPGGRRPNLAPAFIAGMAARLGLRWVPDGKGSIADADRNVRATTATAPTTTGIGEVGQTFLSAKAQQGEPVLHITRRNLPHWTLEGSTYFVTFRTLSGTLDDVEIQMVLEHLKAGDPQYYSLIATTVMPDHVHLLLTPQRGVELARIMKGIKGVSARQINQKRGAGGSVWQDESYDRIVRDQKELDEKLAYMLNNPVKAGLVADGWEYPGLYVRGSEEGADRNVRPTSDSIMSDQVGQAFLPASASQGEETDKNVRPTGETFGPEDVFHYMYAVFHSPTYRERYAEYLKIDFPRLPLTTDRELFRDLCALGERLVKLHLMEAHADGMTRYAVRGDDTVDKVRYTAPGEGAEQGRVWINATQYFEGVPPEVWEFHIGGYQVCEKWLKDRKGRKLSYADLETYQRIVAALAETMRLMDDIDEVIDEHGGWPLAGSSGGAV